MYSINERRFHFIKSRRHRFVCRKHKFFNNHMAYFMFIQLYVHAFTVIVQYDLCLREFEFYATAIKPSAVKEQREFFRDVQHFTNVSVFRASRTIALDYGSDGIVIHSTRRFYQALC